MSNLSESVKILEAVDRKIQEGVEYIGILLNGYSNGFLGERYDGRQRRFVLEETDRKKVERNVVRMTDSLKALMRELEHRVEDGVCREVSVYATSPLPRYLAGGGETKWEGGRKLNR